MACSGTALYRPVHCYSIRTMVTYGTQGYNTFFSSAQYSLMFLLVVNEAIKAVLVTEARPASEMLCFLYC
jgi:hypothetical protein